MCGRYVVAKTVIDALPNLLDGLPGWNPDLENFNMTPGTEVPIVHNQQVGAGGEQDDQPRIVEPVYWGLVASWKKTFKELPKPVNARIETVATNGMFRDAFRYRRCIVPVSAYYEWVPPGGQGAPEVKGVKNTPYLVYTGESPEPTEITGGLACAGIYEDWIDQSVPPDHPMRVRRTMAIITRPAEAAPATIHDRMPAMLTPDDYERWMGNGIASAAEAIDLLHTSTHAVAPSLRVHQVAGISASGYTLV